VEEKKKREGKKTFSPAFQIGTDQNGGRSSKVREQKRGNVQTSLLQEKAVRGGTKKGGRGNSEIEETEKGRRRFLDLRQRGTVAWIV